MSLLLPENFKVSFNAGLFYEDNVIFKLYFDDTIFSPPLFNKYTLSSSGLKQISGIL